MATGRYHQFGVTDPTSNFFKLDYQMLAQPILKADQEYKQLDDAYHQFNQQLSSKEVLPGDVPLLNKRVQEMQAEEKKLRETVNGDILDPRYQEGLRGLVSKQSGDTFYKGAAWNLNLYKQQQQYEKEYAMKYGEKPDAWQNPTGQFFKNYQGFDKSGFGKDAPIDPRFPYQEKAVEYAEPMIKKKLQDQEWVEKTVTGSDGLPHKYLYSKTGARVTKEEIKDVVRKSTIGDGSKQWNQLKTIYDNTPSLQEKYKDFDTYYNSGVLESVASSLSYQWEDVGDLRDVDGSYGTDRASSSRTSSLKEKMTKATKPDFKINEGAYADRPGATNPLLYPNYDIAMKAKGYYASAADDALNGYYKTDQSGNRVKTPSLTERVYQTLGLTENNDKGIRVTTSPMPNSTELGVYMSYTSKDGVQRKVNLLDGEALLRKGEMPDEVAARISDVQLKASEDASRYAMLKHQEEEINRFANRAAIGAFGVDGAKTISKQGFYGVLSNDEKVKFNTADTYRVGANLMAKIERGEGIVKQDITGITGTNSYNALFGGTNAAVKTMKDLSSVLGIPEQSWNVKGANNDERADLFVKSLYQARREGLINKDDIPDLNKQLSDVVAADILSERKDGKMKKYEEMWAKQWTRGLDANGRPLGDEDNASGTKLVNKKIYYYNQTNRTGEGSSEKFWKGGKELIAASLGYTVDGDWNQNATVSNMQLFKYGSNKSVDNGKFKELGADPKNWDLIGISVDDEGFNIIIKDNTVIKKALNNWTSVKDEDSWLEIRNHDMVVDYMVQAGMGSKLVFDTTKQMLKGFADQSQSPVREDIKQDPGVGKSSGATVLSTQSEIGGGIFTRPIERLESPYVDPVTKQEYKTGTFKYYSTSKDKYIYSQDPLDVTLEYLTDRDDVFNKKGTQYQAFSEDTFGGKISVQKNILEKGLNTMSTNMITILNEGIVSDPLLPGNMILTDATREKERAEQYGNAASKHVVGNAVDLVPSKGINDQAVSYFANKAKDLSDVARIILEFPIGDPRAKKYAATYGSEFVVENQGATGAHFHIEYKE